MAKVDPKAAGDARSTKPRELTPKQEAFAVAYVQCGNASDAYRHAYNAGRMKTETIHREAHTLLENPKIATRIEVLQAGHVERHDMTADKISDMLVEAFEKGKSTGSAAAMVTAAMGLGKLHGHVIDKTKISGDADNPVETITKIQIEVVRPQRTDTREAGTALSAGSV